MMKELDLEQVRDLVFVGFTRESAAMAVAESHHQGDEYVEALLDALKGEQLDGEPDEDYRLSVG